MRAITQQHYCVFFRSVRPNGQMTADRLLTGRPYPEQHDYREPDEMKVMASIADRTDQRCVLLQNRGNGKSTVNKMRMKMTSSLRDYSNNILIESMAYFPALNMLNETNALWIFNVHALVGKDNEGCRQPGEMVSLEWQRRTIQKKRLIGTRSLIRACR